jgi:site-specific DNA recombinase
MDILERQKVLRLVVKEILVDDKNIRIKHSIPLLPPDKSGLQKMQPEVPSYLLRSGSQRTALGHALVGVLQAAFHHDSSTQVFSDQAKHPFVMDFRGYPMHQHIVVHRIEANHDTLPTSTVFLRELK